MLAGDSPSPHHQWEGQNRGEDRWTPVPRLVFPHPSLCIWTTRVLQSLTPRPPPGSPRGWLSTPLNCQSMMYDLRWQPMRKKRRLLEPPMNRFRDRNERKRPLRRNRKRTSSAESGNVMPGVGWRRKELGTKKNTTMSEGPLEPVLTPLLTPWDGVSMNGPGKRHTRVLHGLGTYGALVPWTINS